VTACLDENAVFELSLGQLDGAALVEAEAHLDACARCRRVVAAALRASGAEAKAPPALVKRGAAIGRYLVIERVGIGAMGQVFAAYDPVLDRKVALKLLRPSSQSGDDEDRRRARLGREAQTLARLSHPSVVTVFDVGTWEQQLFIALEFVGGGSAREWAAREPRGAHEVVRLWAQAGRGLAAAHAAGVIHRDVKPDNVLVRADGRAQITDFGLASDARPRDAVTGGADIAVTETGVLLGTPVYMAPDQLDGALASEASDQFGFCVSVWEALYGERPFAGRSAAELASAARRGPPRASSSLAVPSSVRRILGRGLDPDPQRRYPSMTALVDALERAVDRPRRVRLAALVGAVAVSVAAVFVAQAGRQAGRHPTCVLAEERHRAAWDDARRAAVEDAFRRTGLSYADRAWGIVDGAVSARASAWRSERAEACEALVNTAQPDPLFRARVACFDERLAELQASVDVLALGGVEPVNHATKIVERMAPVGACAGALTDRAGVEPCEACVVLRADVERSKALRNLGRYVDAERTSKDALSRPAPPAAAAVQAALRVEHATVLEPLGRIDEAEREIFDAALAAHRAGSRALAAEAFAELAFLTGDQRSRPDEGERWALQAEALAEGDEGPLYERIAAVRGTIAARRGDMRVAEGHFRRAEESARRRLGPAHPRRAQALSNLASAILHQGRAEEARTLLKESFDLFVAALGADHPHAFQAQNSYGAALGRAGHLEEAVPVFEAALAGYKRTLGANHPHIGTAALNLAEALFRLKRYGDARARYAEAEEVWERALGAGSPRRVAALGGLGQVRMAEGACAEATSPLEAALAICERAACEPADEATVAFFYAKAAVCAGRPKARVAAHARRALALLRSQESGFEDDISAIEAWLR
jgi:tetratricopeptide (TPR) repeat protein/tRNA A-37 threonylcarbamoyl transferase component Bud32